MFQVFLNRFRRQPKQVAAQAASSAVHGGNAVLSSQRAAAQYPPQDPGLCLASAGDLMASQAHLLQMLEIHCAASKDQFAMRYGNPLHSLAEAIANLPGSANGVFSGPGGLFRACLEMAFNCFRASDGRIFTGDMGVEMRHLLEVRWRYVCFAAGMFYPIGQALQNITVLDGAGKRWSSDLEPLLEWAPAGQTVWVSWSNERGEPGPSPAAAYLAHKVIGRTNIAWLNDGDQDLWHRLIEIATGAPNANTLIATSVVKSTWQSIHEREAARLHQHYGRLTSGTHVSPYLIDAIVALGREKWVLNESTLFSDGKDAFLHWPQAGQDIIEFCRQRELRGIPSTEPALLTMLMSSKVIHGADDGMPLREIAGAGGEIVLGIKLLRPGLVIEDMEKARRTDRKVALADAVAADPLQVQQVDKSNPSPGTQPRSEQAKAAAGVANKGGAPEHTPEKSGGKKAEVAKSRPTLDTIDVEPTPGGTQPPPTVASVNAHEGGAAVQADLPLAADAPSTERSSAATQAKASTKPKSPAGTATKKAAGGVQEGQDITYASNVPPEMATRLKPFSVEVLGKVISLCKGQVDNSQWLIRRVQKGVAVEKDMILDISSKGLDAILEWAESGWLYIDLARPGVKHHPVPRADGASEVVQCVIFTSSAADRLGFGHV